MPTRRTWSFPLLLLLAVVAVGAGWAAWLLHPEDLSEPLVAQANRELPPLGPRPTHVEPATPGSTADALAHHLPALEPLARRLEKDVAARDRAYQVIQGSRPMAELPAPYAAALEQLAPALDGILAATHAERVELPRARDPNAAAEGASWSTYPLVGMLAALRARAALAAGHLDEARRVCLDGLGLGRDLAIAGGVVGRLNRAAITRLLLPPCAEVAADRGVDQPDLLRRIRALRDAAPQLEAAVRQEGVEMQLILFGERLSREQRERLPPRAAAWIKPPAERPGLLSQLFSVTSWSDTVRAYDELTAAAGLAPRDRDAALQQVAQRWGKSWNPNRTVFARAATSLRKYARRDDHTLLRHDFLVFAAAAKLHRDRSGAWPASLADLGELTAEERARLGGASLTEKDGQLRIRVALEEVEGPPQAAALIIDP